MGMPMRVIVSHPERCQIGADLEDVLAFHSLHRVSLSEKLVLEFLSQVSLLDSYINKD
jgi:hypothetical protein